MRGCPIRNMVPVFSKWAMAACRTTEDKESVLAVMRDAARGDSHV